MDSDELGVGAERIIVIEDLPEGPRRPSPGSPTLLANGSTTWRTEVSAGEVVRLSLVNAARSRVLRLRLPGARLKLVASGLGRVEREEPLDELVLAPGERAVVDALFERLVDHVLEHRLPGRSLDLATFAVTPPRPGALAATRFDALRVDPTYAPHRRALASLLERAPDAVVTTSAAPGGRLRHLHAPCARPKVRLVNPSTLGARQHLVTLVGGRLLVLSRDGVPVRNLAWTDVVLLRAGEVVDALAEADDGAAVALRCRDLEADEAHGNVLLHVGVGRVGAGKAG